MDLGSGISIKVEEKSGNKGDN